MIGYKVDLMWAVFYVFCGFSLYTSLVVFFRHDNKGLEVFKNLHLPFVIALYFITPCIALFLSYKAFGEIGNWIFWVMVSLILSLSFFIVFYITTMPNWPIGIFLQTHRIPLRVGRCVLSINFALSLLFIICCSFVLLNMPDIADENNSNGIVELQNKLNKIEKDKTVQQGQIRAIKEKGTENILNNINFITALLALMTPVITFYVSMRILDNNKRKN